MRDAEGSLRLVLPTPSWSDDLALACDEIRMFGLTSIQVTRQMRSALFALEEILAGDERAVPVRRYLEHVDSLIDRSPLDELDRSSARQGNPQGLGLTR